jgi:ferritin-like metal-binding protein YciE
VGREQGGFIYQNRIDGMGTEAQNGVNHPASPIGQPGKSVPDIDVDTTVTDPKSELLSALRHALDMESDSERLLRALLAEPAQSPEVLARVQAHLQETLAQRDAMTACMQRLDGINDASNDASNEAPGDDTPQIRPVAEIPASAPPVAAPLPAHEIDEPVDTLTRLYLFKHREIAMYAGLLELAESSGFFETKHVCEGIWQEETTMAEWLESLLPEAAHVHLSREAQPAADRPGEDAP